MVELSPSKGKRGGRRPTAARLGTKPVPLSEIEGVADIREISTASDKPAETLNLGLVTNSSAFAGISELRLRVQVRIINKIVNYFIISNSVVGTAIAILFIIETFFGSKTNATVINDKVIIAAIAGITIQCGAIIITAFKGLFSAK